MWPEERPKEAARRAVLTSRAAPGPREMRLRIRRPAREQQRHPDETTHTAGVGYSLCAEILGRGTDLRVHPLSPQLRRTRGHKGRRSPSARPPRSSEMLGSLKGPIAAGRVRLSFASHPSPVPSLTLFRPCRFVPTQHLSHAVRVPARPSPRASRRRPPALPAAGRMRLLAARPRSRRRALLLRLARRLARRESSACFSLCKGRAPC